LFRNGLNFYSFSSAFEVDKILVIASYLDAAGVNLIILKFNNSLILL